MKKSKIFIGFNNNRDRCLLYKIDSNNYLDLENNKKYNITDLLETTILPYQRFINLKGINTKNTIKKKYRLDSEKKLPVDDLYIGQLGEVTRIYDIKESKGNNDLKHEKKFEKLNYDFNFFEILFTSFFESCLTKNLSKKKI